MTGRSGDPEESHTIWRSCYKTQLVIFWCLKISSNIFWFAANVNSNQGFLNELWGGKWSFQDGLDLQGVVEAQPKEPVSAGHEVHGSFRALVVEDPQGVGRGPRLRDGSSTWENSQEVAVLGDCLLADYWSQLRLPAIAKCHRWGAQTTGLYFLSLGGQKYKIKVSTCLISPEDSLLGLLVAVFLLCPHMAFHCGCIPGVSAFFL